MNKDEALRLALEALETLHDENMDYLTRNKLGGENNQCMVFAREAITAIKAALEAKDEPVAFVKGWNCGRLEVIVRSLNQRFEIDQPLYTTPPQRTWVGLTDEDKSEICDMTERDERDSVMRLVEAKLKARNI
jgi:hypothetical protein